MGISNNYSGLPSTRWPDVRRYEVFLSFRGGDVRMGFIEFLYKGLANSGIDAFIDYDGIEIGEEIMPTILQVIKHTEICIPIFSKDFAASKSCLREVAEMVECRRTIMPIFYDVSPEVVSKQQENYQHSFDNHAANDVKSATINKWKEALQSVSRKRGWELKKFQHGEHELIDNVVSTVRRLLRKDDLYVTAHLVGMDHPVPEVMKKLDVRYDNGEVTKGQILMGRRVVEISGLPGIGKSTLATVVYNKIHHLFEGKSFLKEVEQRSLLALQEDLVSGLQKRTYTLKSPVEGTEFIKHKFRDLKVLIVLDHVSDFKQINSLAGDLSWFGPGSRIIVISTRSNLVNEYNHVPVTSTSSSNVNRCNDILVEKYVLKQMKDDHAFQLFCKYALRDTLQEKFSSLAWDIVLAAGGIPLVIEVVGSYLHGKPIEFWEEALHRLKREPYTEEVKQILKRRYDELDKYAKEIFLDIACFFVGEDKTIPYYMWLACQYDPHRGVDDLHNTCLVKTGENNEFWMHNQLKVLGREIVKDENPSKPFERSRLWNQEDIEPVLTERKDLQDASVEALSATFDEPHLFPKRRFFNNFSKLRYLKMNHAIVKAYKQNARSSRDEFFLRRLKWLEWQGCNDISSLLALDLSKLIVLDLSGSTSSNWQSWKQIMKRAKNLKVLILKGCRWLSKSPFSHAPANLERLDLEHCSTLPPCVVRSISKLRKLVSLNIKFCTFLKELPKDIGSLESLKELYIDETSIEAIDFQEGSFGKLEILSARKCKSLSLSNSIDNLKSLCYLALDDTQLSELPESVGSLNNLQTLSLRNCRNLWKLPDTIGNLAELQVMDLSDTLVDKLPSSVQGLRSLRVLKMSRTFIIEFPGGIKKLERLEEIDFWGCRNLTGKCDITGLSSLRVLLLENTKYTQVIVTGGQRSIFPNLRLSNSKDGTTKGALHRFHGRETTAQFQADGQHINM